MRVWTAESEAISAHEGRPASSSHRTPKRTTREPRNRGSANTAPSQSMPPATNTRFPACTPSRARCARLAAKAR